MPRKRTTPTADFWASPMRIVRGTAVVTLDGHRLGTVEESAEHYLAVRAAEGELLRLAKRAVLSAGTVVTLVCNRGNVASYAVDGPLADGQ